MSVLKYFKNIPRSPSHRATGPKCNFFLQICNEVPGEKKGGHVRRRGGREAHYGHYLDLASGTFATNLILIYFDLFERVFVIIVGKISAANSYRT